MKTLAENLNNIAVLNKEELNQIIGGEYVVTSSGVEDEDIWM